MGRKKIELEAEKIEIEAEKIETSAVKELSDDNNELKNKISEIKEILPELEEPKKRGRKKGVPNKPKETLPESVYTISPIFDIIINRLPNPIQLTDSEKNLLDNTTSSLINKYISTVDYKEEILAGLVLLTIFYPRLNVPKGNDRKET